MSARVRQVFEGEIGNEIWSLVTLAARLPEVRAQAAGFAEPSRLAKYTFQLAQAFNFFYNRDENRILEERNEVRRAVLVYVTDFVRNQLTKALATLGIEVPERMQLPHTFAAAARTLPSKRRRNNFRRHVGPRHRQKDFAPR